MVPEVSVTNRVVGAPQKRRKPNLLGYRSGYRRCIEQVIYCNSIDLQRVVQIERLSFLSNNIDVDPTFRCHAERSRSI